MGDTSSRRMQGAEEVHISTPEAAFLGRTDDQWHQNLSPLFTRRAKKKKKKKGFGRWKYAEQTPPPPHCFWQLWASALADCAVLEHHSLVSEGASGWLWRLIETEVMYYCSCGLKLWYPDSARAKSKYCCISPPLQCNKSLALLYTMPIYIYLYIYMYVYSKAGCD